MTPALAAYLDAVQARCDRATPGPWVYQENSDAYTHIVREASGAFMCQFAQDTTGKAEGVARFMAHARDDVPTLVQLVRELGEWIAGEHEPDHTDNPATDCVVCEILARADVLLPGGE